MLAKNGSNLPDIATGTAADQTAYDNAVRMLNASPRMQAPDLPDPERTAYLGYSRAF